MAGGMLKFYSAWFCPYAQRTWIALNHLKVKYELTESLKITQDGAYEKNADLLKLNPKGLVPTLHVPNGEVVVESIDTLEYLNKKYNNESTDFVTPKLVEEAHKMNKIVCSPFYLILMKPEESEREEAWHNFTQGLEKFTEGVVDGGFFNSATHMNIVDVTVFPWAVRLSVLQHYRGKQLDTSLPWVKNFMAWRDRMLACEAVSATVADDTKLLAAYARYAEGSAKSKVGDAVRAGNNAHDV